MLKNIKTYFFIGFSPTILYNNDVGKQINHNAYKQTYPHTPQHIMWDMYPYPLTDESPWGGFSCPHNTMTQWGMGGKIHT